MEKSVRLSHHHPVIIIIVRLDRKDDAIPTCKARIAKIGIKFGGHREVAAAVGSHCVTVDDCLLVPLMR